MVKAADWHCLLEFHGGGVAADCDPGAAGVTARLKLASEADGSGSGAANGGPAAAQRREGDAEAEAEAEGQQQQRGRRGGGRRQRVDEDWSPPGEAKRGSGRGGAAAAAEARDAFDAVVSGTGRLPGQRQGAPDEPVVVVTRPGEWVTLGGARGVTLARDHRCMRREGLSLVRLQSSHATVAPRMPASRPAPSRTFLF
jgi:hypothetical protein